MIRLALTVLMALSTSTPAFAATRLFCRAPDVHSFFKGSMTEMDLQLSQGLVSGAVMTDRGWLKIGGTGYYRGYASMKESRVTVGYFAGNDTLLLEFDFVAGAQQARFYEQLTGIGERASTVTITCQKL